VCRAGYKRDGRRAGLQKTGSVAARRSSLKFDHALGLSLLQSMLADVDEVVE
jgi:hypothetical protein